MLNSKIGERVPTSNDGSLRCKNQASAGTLRNQRMSTGYEFSEHILKYFSTLGRLPNEYLEINIYATVKTQD